MNLFKGITIFSAVLALFYFSLVSCDETDPLTIPVDLDPIVVDINVSIDELSDSATVTFDTIINVNVDSIIKEQKPDKSKEDITSLKPFEVILTLLGPDSLTFDLIQSISITMINDSSGASFKVVDKFAFPQDGSTEVVLEVETETEMESLLDTDDFHVKAVLNSRHGADFAAFLGENLKAQAAVKLSSRVKP